MIEKAIAKDPSLIGCFSVAGDSMIFVDKTGKRVVNEKLHYNELAQMKAKHYHSTDSVHYLGEETYTYNELGWLSSITPQNTNTNGNYKWNSTTTRAAKPRQLSSRP